MKKPIILIFTIMIITSAAFVQADRFITTDSENNILIFTDDSDKSQISTSQIGQKAADAYPDKRVYVDLNSVIPIIGADTMWDSYGLRGSGVAVCVIDTGIDDSLDQFSGRIVDQACFCDDEIPEDGVGCCPNGAETDTEGNDENGHGTHVAGIVGANDATYSGVAPQVDIVAVRVLDSQGEGYLSDVLKGLQYCVDNADLRGIKVVSMSFGTNDLYDSYCDDELELLTNVVNEGYANGITFFSSSGNEGSSTSVRLPACLQNVVSVGSTSDNDTLSAFTNSGPLVDILAPGEQVQSVYPGGSYASLSGTSMSVPQAAGAAALLLEAKPYMTPSEIKAALMESDVFVEGYPRLDLLSAYDYISENEIPEFGSVTALVALLGAALALAVLRIKK